MLAKLKDFLWKYQDNLNLIIAVTLLGIPILLGGGFFLLRHTQTVGHLISQEERVIEVVNKEANDLRGQRCKIKGPDGGCAVYEPITRTLYVVITPTETFFTEAEIYDQLESGRVYRVTVSGWRSPVLPPRRITDLLEEE